MKLKENKETKARQVESPKVLVKDLAVNIVFAVCLFPLAAMPLINPLYRFCYSSENMEELKRKIVVSALILLGVFVVMISGAVLLAIRRRKKRLTISDNSAIAPKRKLCGIWLRVIQPIIAISLAVLALAGGIISSLQGGMNTLQRVILIAFSIALSAFIIWILYMTKGIISMCRKCRCFFFLEHYGKDERVRSRKTLGVVTEDVYQGRKYVDSKGEEYKVYNTEERLAVVRRTIFKANYRCKYCGMRYFSFYSEKE